MVDWWQLLGGRLCLCIQTLAQHSSHRQLCSAAADCAADCAAAAESERKSLNGLPSQEMT